MQEPRGFARFKQRSFDTLDTQLASARPKLLLIKRSLQELNPLVESVGDIRRYM
jgi:hypothetical protein